MPGRLQGRIALVTGGLRGIGAATAALFLAEGAIVIASDLDSPDAVPAADFLRSSPQATYLRLDVTQEDEWTAARDYIAQVYGRLDILVNNAGSDLTGKVTDLSLDAWRRLMAVNMDSVFLGTKTLTGLLAKGGAQHAAGAAIINVSSIMGLVGMGEVSAYNASKGAVRLFSKSTALEFTEAGIPIRVNSLHPGFVQTPLFDAGMRRWSEKSTDVSEAALVAGVAANIPMRRLARAEEIASTILFLASDDASYMTGSELVVDGGWTAR